MPLLPSLACQHSSELPVMSALPTSSLMYYKAHRPLHILHPLLPISISLYYTQRAQEFISLQDCRQTYYVIQDLLSANSLRNALYHEGTAIQLQASGASLFCLKSVACN